MQLLRHNQNEITIQVCFLKTERQTFLRRSSRETNQFFYFHLFHLQFKLTNNKINEPTFLVL